MRRLSPRALDTVGAMPHRATLAHEERGEGPALVLSHGHPAAVQGFAERVRR
jgi:hypothetical protein